MSITAKLVLLPNQLIALALGVKEEDSKFDAKKTLAKDLIWAIKTAKKDIFVKEEEVLQDLISSLLE